MEENKMKQIEELKNNIADFDENNSGEKSPEEIREQAINNYLDRVGEVSEEINSGFEKIEAKVRKG